MQLFQLALLSACVCVAVLSAPTTDPGYKPVLAPATPADNSDDPYKSLHAPWKEPKSEKYVPTKPQTGSLLSTEVTVTPDRVLEYLPKNQSAIPAIIPPKQIVDLNITNHESTANPTSDYYPIEKDPTVAAYKESREGIAPPPVTDPSKKDLFGVQPSTVVIDRPEDPHPMEIKTPIPDNAPCDPDRILNVTIPAVQIEKGQRIGYLPLRYGCSTAFDVSREKISPEVYWDNVSNDVVDFSLQMIDMGDSCSGNGTEYGRIHWHVTGIKGAPSVTLREGASHDRRLLFGGTEQPNQWLEEYYSGPCPVPSVTGCFRIKVLAHRANGRCQCGFQDFLFARPAKPVVESLVLEKARKN